MILICITKYPSSGGWLVQPFHVPELKEEKKMTTTESSLFLKSIPSALLFLYGLCKGKHYFKCQCFHCSI